VYGFAEVKRRTAAMDVDRIAPMGGVGQEPNPSWTREKMRRRKFAEEVDPEVQGETEESTDTVVEEEGHDGLLDVIA
jgi:hypothetical protein